MSATPQPDNATNIITMPGVQTVASEWHEYAICGAVLHNQSQFLTCADIVEPSDFTVPFCAEFWRVAVCMVLDGQVLDRGMIATNLMQPLSMSHQDVLERITKLLAMPGKTDNGEQYAKIISERAQRLRMVQAVRQNEKRILDLTTPLEQVIDVSNDAWFKATLTANEKPADIGSSIERTIDTLKKQAKLTNNTVPTGFDNFDEWSGGIKRGEVGLVVGNNGTGKTQWLLTVIRAVGMFLGDLSTKQAQTPMIAFFSLEMSEDQINRNFIQMESNVYRSKTHNPEKLDTQDWDALATAQASISKWNVLMFDSPKYNTVEAIKRKVRELQQKHDVVSVVIDGLWKLKNPHIVGTKNDTGNVQHYPHTAPAVVEMARSLNVGVLMAHQYNKDGKKHILKNTPELWCLDGAGFVTNDVQMVLAIKKGVSASRDFYPIKARGLTARDEPFGMDYDSKSALYFEYIDIDKDTNDVPF